jgi:ribosomal protein S18 acetylase RimI-like enzyme
VFDMEIELMAIIALQDITTAEQDELHAMVAAYWEELVPEAPVARDPQRAAAYLAEHFRFGDDTVALWWVLHNGARAGFVRVERWTTADERGGFIRDFYIHPDVRRRGVGTAVVQAIRAVAERDGWMRIDLNVRADNPSGLAFWQAQGFNLQLYQLRQFVAPDAG